MTAHGNARTERFTRRGNGQGHDEAVPSRLVLVLRLSFVSHLHPRRSQRGKKHEGVRTPRATSRGKAETSGGKGYSRRADESELRAHACAKIQVAGANAPARPLTHRVRVRIDLSLLRTCFQIGLVSSLLHQRACRYEHDVNTLARTRIEVASLQTILYSLLLLAVSNYGNGSHIYFFWQKRSVELIMIGSYPIARASAPAPRVFTLKDALKFISVAELGLGINSKWQSSQ
jgi:hypothetical protein